MNLIKYEPYRNDPWTELDQFFASSFPELLGWRPRTTTMSGSIPLDLFEDKEKRVVRMELPGFRREDVQLELENAVLSVNAKREKDEEKGREAMELQRTVTVGDDINHDAITAKLEDGLLTVTLPKKEQAKPRAITVS